METLKDHYSIQEMAEALEVSKSGLHAHRRQSLGLCAFSRTKPLRPLIAQSFEQSRRTDGCPRIQIDLRALGLRCGKNRILRLMQQMGLRSKQKRRFKPRPSRATLLCSAHPELAGPSPRSGASRPNLAKPHHRRFQQAKESLGSAEGR